LSTAEKRAPVHVVAGVLNDAAGRVLLAQRPLDKHLAGSWEFPGGKLEAGEDRLEGLRRELLEELGVVLQSAQPLIRLRHSYPDRDIDLDVWLVTAYCGEPAGQEHQSLRWCALKELRQAGLLPADQPVIEALLAAEPVP
jgi:8-oxo-dGTP diphosphatase